jgi:iron complex outermembrane receptor protein
MDASVGRTDRRLGHRRLLTTLMMTTALCMGAAPTALPVRQAAAQAQRTHTFNIPSQPLNRALRLLADQSGVQLAYRTAVASGATAPGVNGTMTTEQALSRLLAGSSLRYSFTNANTATILDASTPPSPGGANAQGSILLDTIEVQGTTGNPNALIGNLPPVYPGGLVARGGQVGLLGNRNFMDTPFNQTSYTSKLIQDQQARTIADVLNNDPSVRTDQPGGAAIDQFTIRGFLAGNQDIAFNGLYGIAPTSNGMMAVESVERVEVLKGPNALLNGMAPFGSVGGSINIVPKRAGEIPITQFTPSFYSDGQLGGHVDIGRRFQTDAGSFGVRFNGVYRDGDSAIERQSQETRVAALGLDFRGETVRLSADLGYQFRDTDGPRRPLRVDASVTALPEPPKSRTNYSQPWLFQNNENTYGALRGEVDLAENWTAFAAVGGSLFRFKGLNENLVVVDTAGTIATVGTVTPSAVRIREDTATAEAGMRGSVATGLVHHDLALTHTLFWKETGSVFRPAATGLTSNLYNPVFWPEPNFGVLPSPGDAPKTAEQALSSVAFADTLSVLDKRIQLTLGLRRQNVKVDNFNGVTGARTSSYDKSAVTPAAGLVVKPLEYLSLYANYIEGLSPGQIAPFNANNAGEIFPPFITKQHEVGVKMDFGRFATTISLFQITQPTAFINPATNIFGVDGEQRNRGLELMVFGEVTDGVRLLGGVTLMDSTLTKTQGGINQGNDGIAVPAIQLNLTGEWDVPLVPGLTLLARGIYTSSQYLNAANTQELPAWTRFDLGARYVVKAGPTPIVIRVSVENVFDANYWANASRGQLGLSTPRTFLLSSTFSF